jgi:hypothetical protein
VKFIAGRSITIKMHIFVLGTPDDKGGDFFAKLMFEQFLGKLRKYEIRMRKAVTSERHGNFHSVFKGSGLEFDDLRLYQYGDDVRAIDWNTSAKGHGTLSRFSKRIRSRRHSSCSM